MTPFQLFYEDTLDSTQNEALQRLERGTLQKYDVLYCAYQTKGRGRYAHSWESLRGNILCTIILDELLKEELTLLSAQAVVNFLSLYLPLSGFRIKSPNDVLFEGEKIAGILVEVNSPHVLLGVGINIQQAPLTCDQKTTCIANHTKVTHSLKESLTLFLNVFHTLYTQKRKAIEHHEKPCQYNHTQ